MAGTMLVSLDFELFWGMQDCVPLEKYRENVLGGRQAVAKMLDLFEKHGIHATWATVGFQFAESFEELKPFLPAEELRPSYDKKDLSTYRCFETIGADEQTAPCFYAGSLIREIAAREGQEIASHTFSHYYCREPGQTVEQFEADMAAAKAIALSKGIPVTSVVFPRNQTTQAHVDVLRRLGYRAYRDEENDWIHRIKIRPLMRGCNLADVYLPLTGQGGFVPRNENGIANLMGSRMYKPFFKPLGFLEGLKIYRIKRQMLHAAKHDLCFHLWWHPHNVGTRTEFHLAQLEEIFTYYDYLREKYGMCSKNMREAGEELLNK